MEDDDATCRCAIGCEKVRPPAKAPQDYYIEELQQLAELHTKGILSDEEFEAKKWQLLGLWISSDQALLRKDSVSP